MSFTDRQWNQIKAALTFWSAVAESSRVHPMEHPSVRDYFGNDKPTPLTKEEIEALLLAADVNKMDPLTTITIVSEKTGISRERLQRQLDKMGVEPSMIYGRTYIYSSMALMTAARVLLSGKRNRHVEPEPKTP